MAEGVVDEELAAHTFALPRSGEIRKHHKHGIDRAPINAVTQFVDGQMGPDRRCWSREGSHGVLSSVADDTFSC